MFSEARAQSIYNLLINDKTTINGLDPENEDNLEAVFLYVSKFPSKIEELKNSKEKRFLEYCIKENYELFIYLSPSQYEESIANYYLTKKIAIGEQNNLVTASKGFDKKTIFTINYTTCDGEQVYYHDSDLNISTNLLIDLDVSLKLDDTISFIKKLDVAIENVGNNTVSKELIKIVNFSYRKAISAIVLEKNTSIYKLNSNYDQIIEKIKAELKIALKDSGLSIKEIIINKLYIPDSTRKLIANHSLQLLKENREKEINLEYEKKSLENLALKADIYGKYPDVEIGLTEAEKDFAFDRYKARYKLESGIFDKELVADQLSDRKKFGNDESLKKHGDAALIKAIKRPYIFFFVVAIIALISSIICLANSGNVAGFIVLLIVAGLSFWIGISRASKNKHSSAIVIDNNAETPKPAETPNPSDDTQNN